MSITIERTEYAPSGCRWSTVVVLLAAMIYLGCEMVSKERECDRLRAKVAKLESELPPPHMWSLFTDKDGKRWAKDPWRPWLKPVPGGEFLEGMGSGKGWIFGTQRRAGDR